MKNARLSIPIQLLDFVQRNKLQKPFKLYLALKMFCSGKFYLNSAMLHSIKKINGLKDQRTIDLHLKKLLELKWITQSNKSGIYFIAGFDYLRSRYQFTKISAVPFKESHFNDLNGFIAGALIIQNIKLQQHANRKKNASKYSRIYNRDNANKESNMHLPKDYFGLSNNRGSEILYCKQTRACQLKAQAENLGLIKTKEHLILFATLQKADFNFIKFYKLYEPTLAKKLKCRKVKGKNIIEVLLQLPDEIIPETGFVIRKKIKNNTLVNNSRGL